MLLARYIFDDPSQFNKDYSGNTTGVIGGTLKESDKAAPGFSKCASFNGSSYVQIGRKAMPTDSITVAAWIYGSSIGTVISCTDYGGWAIYETNNKKIAFELFIEGVGYKDAFDNVNASTLLNEWHLVVGTYSNGKLKFYRDGKLISEVSTEDANHKIGYNSSNYCFIGAEPSGTSAGGPYFKGDLSDVRIYSEALSDSQIKYMYDNPSSISINKIDTSNGRLISNGGEFIENKTPSFNKDGVINCSEIIEGSSASINTNGKLYFKEFIEV